MEWARQHNAAAVCSTRCFFFSFFFDRGSTQQSGGRRRQRLIGSEPPPPTTSTTTDQIVNHQTGSRKWRLFPAKKTWRIHSNFQNMTKMKTKTLNRTELLEQEPSQRPLLPRWHMSSCHLPSIGTDIFFFKSNNISNV